MEETFSDFKKRTQRERLDKICTDLWRHFLITQSTGCVSGIQHARVCLKEMRYEAALLELVDQLKKSICCQSRVDIIFVSRIIGEVSAEMELSGA